MPAKPPEDFRTGRLDSPAGVILLVWDEAGALRALDFADYEARMHRLLRRQYGGEVRLSPGTPPRALVEALQAYFAGDLTAPDALTVQTGGTDFQRQVWAMLRRIPAGATWSYGDLARAIGRPKAVRAVGLANGANPVAIVTPCHRVIGSDGSLTGYGGGLDRKRWLLAHEGVQGFEAA